MNGRINLSCGKEVMTSTSISDNFIDNYLSAAHGSYVKVYIYLMRCLHDTSLPISVEEISNRVGESENDVIKALRYWEREGFLRVSYDADGDVRDITVENFNGFSSKDATLIASEAPARPTRTSGASSRATGTASRVATSRNVQPDIVKDEDDIIVPTYTPLQIQRFRELDDFNKLINDIEGKTGKHLSVKTLQTPSFLYESLEFSVDLIEYLYDYCIGIGKAKDSYIEATAIDWKKNGIMDVDDARIYVSRRSEAYGVIIKALGITGRNLGTGELAYLTRWQESGYDIELIREACTRALSKGSTINQLRYADSILSSWKEKGVETLKGVENEDKAFKESRSRMLKSGSDYASVKATSSVPKNSFTSFSQRKYSSQELAEFERKKMGY